MGSTGELVDTFSGADAGALWEPYATDLSHASFSQPNNAVVLTTDGTQDVFAGYLSLSTYSLLGCHAAIEVRQAPSQSLDLLTEFQLVNKAQSGKKNYVSFDLLKGTLSFFLVVNDMTVSKSSIPYDPVEHRWWRFHEVAGNVQFETAPDGTTWSIRYQVATPSFVNTVSVNFSLGATASASPGDSATFDNMNNPPP